MGDPKRPLRVTQNVLHVCTLRLSDRPRVLLLSGPRLALLVRVFLDVRSVKQQRTSGMTTGKAKTAAARIVAPRSSHDGMLLNTRRMSQCAEMAPQISIEDPAIVRAMTHPFPAGIRLCET